MQRGCILLSTVCLTLLGSAAQLGALPKTNLQTQIADRSATPGHHHSPGASHRSGSLSDDHEHGSLEVPTDQPIPTVNLIVHPDSRRGWNLEVQVTNFRFAPERVNQASSSTNEGHAHLYVNGVKQTRLYGNWYYLESLPPGKHQITVSLNANGHEALMYNGQPIQATAAIEVPVAVD
ncbi:MAG: hypothetical protein EDM05_054595 [Leptolyngbya sp. IPPAS B-1204]|nr:hypothetical protein [Elainella sp. C42_A2020_010]RNJ71129.1 MAG: hypothetical protein EDM05_00515 [Leptolyngbya sp. IPPAS B-1204]